MKFSQIVLRAETKPGERRTALSPADLVRLRDARKIPVLVERSAHRVFADSAFEQLGFAMVPAGHWKSCGADTLVVGLKELETESFALAQTHLFFAHAYKGQQEAPQVLDRFQRGQGLIFDLESLRDERNRRLVAFGFWAGYVGAGVGILELAGDLRTPLSDFGDSESLRRRCAEALAGKRPRVVVTGALGRAGRGAMKLLESLELDPVGLDQAELADPAVRASLAGYDLLVHCVGGNASAEPFLTREALAGARLQVLSDVTCDFTNPSHLFPFYRSGTDLKNPVLKVDGLRVIAVDHLPTLLSRESSEEFSSGLLPLLESLLAHGAESGPWATAKNDFHQAMGSIGMKSVHWLGAGLSAYPGFRSLQESAGVELHLWNRTREKALDWAEGLPAHRVHTLELSQLRAAVKPGDVVVSFLPATRHVEIAELCLARKAHLFTSSYVSPEMARLDGAAKEAGLYFVNELGLDPGIDHLFAHLLVHDFFAATQGKEIGAVEFLSACGGFPQEPGPFRYAFSWSPLGVLRALRNKARWLEKGNVKESARIWDDMQPCPTPMGAFEKIPNRDSLAFLEGYGLAALRDRLSFQRGTLRPQGWRAAWAGVLREVETATDAQLEDTAKRLQAEYSYRDGEKDRIVLYVGLKASAPSGETLFDSYLGIDATGLGADTAMARSVSGTTAVGVQLFLAGEFQKYLQPGVQGFPSHEKLNPQWLPRLDQFGLKVLR